MDEEKCLFPGSDHPGQQHQEQPVRLPIDRAFDLSTQDDQLVSQQRVFRQQFGFASRQISKRPKEKGSWRGFDPRQETYLNRMKAEEHLSLHAQENTKHQ